jgi:hypothetical protein
VGGEGGVLKKVLLLLWGLVCVVMLLCVMVLFDGGEVSFDVVDLDRGVDYFVFVFGVGRLGSGGERDGDAGQFIH